MDPEPVPYWSLKTWHKQALIILKMYNSRCKEPYLFQFIIVEFIFCFIYFLNMQAFYEIIHMDNSLITSIRWGIFKIIIFTQIRCNFKAKKLQYLKHWVKICYIYFSISFKVFYKEEFYIFLIPFLSLKNNPISLIIFILSMQANFFQKMCRNSVYFEYLKNFKETACKFYARHQNVQFFILSIRIQCF